MKLATAISLSAVGWACLGTTVWWLSDSVPAAALAGACGFMASVVGDLQKDRADAWRGLSEKQEAMVNDALALIERQQKQYSDLYATAARAVGIRNSKWKPEGD